MPPDPKRLDWRVIDDGVMGGLSRGHVEAVSRGVCFSGTLSIENQGGFSSIRAPVQGIPAATAAFRLDVTGDGRAYQFRLRETDHPAAPAWRASFDTTGARETVVLALRDFEPVLRGRQVRRANPLEAGAIRFLGFMLNSRRPGPFALTVHAIEYGPEAVVNA
jgi:NADH dehydrogenase [ubiquinone] 1 alpha subcomplex assembly factor 1